MTEEHDCTEHFQHKEVNGDGETVKWTGYCEICGKTLVEIYDYQGTYDTEEEKWVDQPSAGSEVSQMGQTPTTRLSCVDEVESGDWKDIDDYKRELREAGFDAEYENVYRSATGATAIVYVNGQEHAVFEMDVTGQIVRDVENTLQQCAEDCDLPKNQ